MVLDINATMNNMMDSAKAPSKPSEAPKDVLDVITGGFDRMIGAIAKISGLNFIAKLGSQPVLPDSEGLGVINKGASSFTSGGGPLFNAFSALLTIDFKGLVAAAVEAMSHLTADGLHVTHMSYGELGTLTPSVTFGGSVISEGLSIG